MRDRVETLIDRAIHRVVPRATADACAGGWWLGYEYRCVLSERQRRSRFGCPNGSTYYSPWEIVGRCAQ